MVLLTECRICGEKLKYTPDTVATLGVHAAVRHPSANANYFSFYAEVASDTLEDEEYGNEIGNGEGGERGKGSGGGNDKKGKKSKKASKKGSKSTTSRKKLYKTTVETWKPGMGELTCVECGKTGTPLLRRKRNLIARTPLGALCMLGCWPICFLPFLCGKGGRCINVYCSNCGTFLGMYNSQTGKLTPNDKNARMANNNKNQLKEATLYTDGTGEEKNCAELTEALFCDCDQFD